MEAAWRGKRPASQGVGSVELLVETIREIRLTHLSRIEPRHPWAVDFRQADPEIQTERIGDLFTPIVPKCLPRQPPWRLIRQGTKCLRMVAMASS